MNPIEKAGLAGSYFGPRNNWDFKEWAAESRGVYHGDASTEVQLCLAKSVAKRPIVKQSEI